MSGLIIQDDTTSSEALQARKAAVDAIEKLHLSQPQWFDCKTAAEYRRMRREGTNGFPQPFFDPRVKKVTVSARDGASIDLFVFAPQPGDSKGVVLHFHAGGFVIGSARSYDKMLGDLADATALTWVSVEYRLAPEHVYPIGQNDCLDAALFALTADGEKALGGRLRVLAGESAGAYLTVWVALALRDSHGIDVRQRFDCLVPSYGLFDMTYTPSVLGHKRRALLGKEEMVQFVEAEFGTITAAVRKTPAVSPLYGDFQAMAPALFIVGTMDPLIDDSVFMASRWHEAGNEAKVVLFREACHGFTLFPVGDSTQKGLGMVVEFIKAHLR